MTDSNINYDVPIYDPYKDPGTSYFHPGNEEAQYLVYIMHIYSDIERLFGILVGISDKYGKKLIAKHIVVECLSMDVHIQKLINIILSGRTKYIIDDNSRQELHNLYIRYKSARHRKFSSFKMIRNKIGAHRELLYLPTVSEIWDSVDILAIAQFLSYVPPVYNFMKNLNIYCWTKTENDESGNEVIALLQPFKYRADSV